jgi:hypothetical protein
MDDTPSSGREDDDISLVKKKMDTAHNELDSLHDFSKARLGMIFNSSYFPLLSLERRRPVRILSQPLVLSDSSAAVLSKDNMNAEKESLPRDEGEKEMYSRTELPFIQKNIIKEEKNSIKENLDKEENFLRQLPIGSILQNSMEAASRSILLRNRVTISDFANLFNADAITLGKNIFFSQGSMDDLATPSGQALYVHEMVHVIQSEDDTELQKGMIPLSRVSFLEEEAAKVEKSFLNYMRVGGQHVNRFMKDRLGNESFVRNWLVGSFDSSNLTGSSTSSNSYISSIADNKADSDSQRQKEVFAPRTSSMSSYTAPIAINSDSLDQIFPNLQYHISVANSSLISKNRSNTERSPTPLFAIDSRAVNASAALSPQSTLSSSAMTAPPSSSSSSLDIERLSDQVYEMIMRRIRMERDRRGIK